MNKKHLVICMVCLWKLHTIVASGNYSTPPILVLELVLLVELNRVLLQFRIMSGCVDVDKLEHQQQYDGPK
jgi:hypothetical protein